MYIGIDVVLLSLCHVLAVKLLVCPKGILHYFHAAFSHGFHHFIAHIVRKLRCP
jgi:hypothetical protein